MLEYPRLPLISVESTTRLIMPGVVQQHASLSEGRLSYAVEPLREIDITYNGLREGFWAGSAYDELSQLEGLFVKCAGMVGGFKYHSARQHKVFKQLIGSTDGSTTAFDLIANCGPPSNAALQWTEHVGVLDLNVIPFALYIDASAGPVSPFDAVYGYTLNTATPGKQQIIFNSAPPATHALYVDMGFFFYARFLQSPLEYQKFAQNLYQAQTVTLRTLRAESL